MTIADVVEALERAVRQRRHILDEVQREIDARAESRGIAADQPRGPTQLSLF